MENFLVCFNAVLPIFLLLLLGYIAKCAKLLDRKDVSKFNKVAFRTFMPILMFYSIYSSDLSSAIRPKLIIFTVIGILCAFGLSLFMARLTAVRQNQKGVIAQGIFRSNFVIIGMPMVQSLCGDENMGCVAMMLAVVVPCFNILAVVVLSIYNGEKPDVKETLLNIIKNPLILGAAVGILFLVLGIKLPEPIMKAAKQVYQAASPLMLFLLGAFFELGSLKSEIKELTVTVFGRLILIPGLALGAAWFLGFRGVELACLLGVFASSAAVNSFTMAQQMGGDAELAGNVVVMTSALCSFTLFLWSFLFKSLGAF